MTNIPTHHQNSTRTLFTNPWNTAERPGSDETLSGTMNGSWLKNFSSISSLFNAIPVERARDLSGHDIVSKKVLRPKFTELAESKATLDATWLGHASFLVQFPSRSESSRRVRILFDPIFSDWAGPSSWLGVYRHLPPPCTIEELPEYSFVLISHNHYDHLDLPSILEIVRLRGRNVHFLVPLGLKKWFEDSGISSGQVSELDWWDEVELSVPTKNSHYSDTQTKFICVPAQHTSGRSITDNCSTLWCGWIVKHHDAQIFYAGDTGYMGNNEACSIFKEIGERYGPFDLSMILIWRGGTLSFVSRLGFRLTHNPYFSRYHASPVDALAIHKDVRSRHSLAMHFGTFVGSDLEAREALIELSQACLDSKVGSWNEEGGFGAIDIGETAQIKLESEHTINGKFGSDTKN